MRFHRLGLVFVGLTLAMFGLVVLFVALAPGDMLLLPADVDATATAQQAAACRLDTASQPQPELTQSLADAITVAGDPDATFALVAAVEVEAVGRGCRRADGSVQDFRAQRTDITFTLDTTSDSQAAADLIDALLAVLAQDPPTPPADAPPGDLRFIFTDDTRTVAYEQTMAAFVDGQRGMALLE
ncbi:MAG: hypothetical protein ACOCZH_01510 [Phototrophicaceae bacterium]